jgi:hypothetical protein
VRSLVFPYTQLGGHFVPISPVTLFGRTTSFKTDGNFIPAYSFRLLVQIDDIKIRAPVAFSDKLTIGFNLLGRQAIFSSFEEVAFCEREKRVIFRARA